jgi:hypothetical protein
MMAVTRARPSAPPSIRNCTTAEVEVASRTVRAKSTFVGIGHAPRSRLSITAGMINVAAPTGNPQPMPATNCKPYWPFHPRRSIVIVDMNPVPKDWKSDPTNIVYMIGRRLFPQMAAVSPAPVGVPRPNDINRTPARHGVSPLTAWKRSGIWITQVVKTAPRRNVCPRERQRGLHSQ